MLYVIPTNRKLFSGRPNRFSIVISIVTAIPQTQKAHKLCVTQLQAKKKGKYLKISADTPIII